MLVFFVIISDCFLFNFMLIIRCVYGMLLKESPKKIGKLIGLFFKSFFYTLPQPL